MWNNLTKNFFKKRLTTGLKWYISNIAIDAININSVRFFQYKNLGSNCLALLELACERNKCPTADNINTILINIIKNTKKSRVVSNLKKLSSFIYNNTRKLFIKNRFVS